MFYVEANGGSKRFSECVKAIRGLYLAKSFYSNFGFIVLLLWSCLFCAVRLFGFSVDELMGHVHVFCPFKALTGIPCPGCGMTRAFLALAEFDFVGASHLNPFSLPLFAFFVFSALNATPLIPQRINDYLPTFILLVIVFWWSWARLVPGVFI